MDRAFIALSFQEGGVYLGESVYLDQGVYLEKHGMALVFIPTVVHDSIVAALLNHLRKAVQWCID